jgi:hypothetical protein
MKQLIIVLIAVIIFHLNGFSQLFDATIDGGTPRLGKELVAHYEKKGYNVVKDVAYPNELIFMMGMLRLDGGQGKNYPVLLHLTKGDSTDFVHSIAAYFTPDFVAEFEQHKQKFQDKFGLPISNDNKKAVWQLRDYKYTIGLDNDGMFHEVKINKPL